MRTVGVEEELLLVDRESGEPRALSSAVLARAARDTGENSGAERQADDYREPEEETFERELHGQQLEFATQPRSDMADLADEVARWRADAARHAGDVGAAVAALATSPLPVSPAVNTGSRFQWMEEQFGLTTQEQLTGGCHVHVSVESDEEGVAVIDRIRSWLPVLVALSANSPFWQGNDSQYSSYRNRVWGRWPMAGPTEIFGSAERYEEQVAEMTATGVLRDRGMVYFDARLSHRYPTVEIRVSDVCLEATSTVLIATLARGLVETAARDWRAERPPLPHGVASLRLAAWRAARSGLEDTLLDPVTMRPAPSDEVVRGLLDHVGEALEDAGDLDLARTTAEDLLKHGNGARVQRDLLERTGSLREVVKECVRRTSPV
ncbi:MULTISPECIES: glutamate--cysteine ligase [Streptomyces]|uniref:Putative glutamate--cysteine ligase 2 n=1 Tax=Streptomyces venezuelae TaxID=54571 RepID=A0A5P2BK19_STRVZ|nr:MULTISPECIES: glutamate--cysteine ligase [Streptomyces]NEA04741.1 YbdK family carboxylate-amine ligase [Streptomyces sp. SID10116]MYY80687.1 YbdK family carboxylate-amine ligase [Streptomyces sp. SID335]MYZ11885.1 YbdK family carboxylate-amine ligase [Streptomyces sp. SID337]MYZ13796.1 YbdK family carboxylate-amine ligase [Streptomyces sp. SID337]NDZ89207.1 YbdK family carboxylate-amine ligase [Streptomyces sp. SID10115]